MSPPKVVQQELQQVLLLEDDVRFEPSFGSRLVTIMGNVQRVGLEWDLMCVNHCSFCPIFRHLSTFVIKFTSCLCSVTHLCALTQLCWP